MEVPRHVFKLMKMVRPPWWKFSVRGKSSRYAAKQLWKYGPEVVPFLLGVMESGKAPEREAARGALDDLGPEDGEALPALIEAFKKSKSEAVARAIGRLGPKAEPALAQLIELMPHIPPAAQEAIMGAMIEMGVSALRGWRHALLDVGVHWAARLRAAEAIATLGREAVRAVDALVIALQDPFSKVRHAAAAGLEVAGVRTAKAAASIMRPAIVKARGLGGHDLMALMLIKRLHGSDPLDLRSAAQEIVQHEAEEGRIWQKLSRVLQFNPAEYGDTSMVILSTEMIIYRLITGTKDEVRVEYVGELGRRRAGWTAALLKGIAADPACSEELRFACQEVSSWA
jgi:HEAT repeat protein